MAGTTVPLFSGPLYAGLANSLNGYTREGYLMTTAHFPAKVLGRHAYVVLKANTDIAPTLERGSILFDSPYFPGLHWQDTLNTKTGEIESAYLTRWLFKVRPDHSVEDLELARDEALLRGE